MTISAINIRNLTTTPLSLDLIFEPDRQVRRLIPLAGTIDISDVASVDELNRNAIFQQLLAAGSVSMTLDPPGTSNTDLEGSSGALLGRVGAPALDFVTGSTLSVGGIPQAKAIAGRDLLQGQAAAALQLGTGTSSVSVVAVRPGEPGNLITLALVDAAAASVVVAPATVVGERPSTPTTVTVNYRGPANGNVDNANAIATLINTANTDSSFLLAATGGGAGNVTPASGTLAGGTGAGFKVFAGGAEMNVNDPVTDTALAMTTLTDVLSGIVAGNGVAITVISNGSKSNALSVTGVA